MQHTKRATTSQTDYRKVNSILTDLRTLKQGDDSQNAKVEIASEGGGGQKGWMQKYFEHEADRDVVEFTGIRDEVKGIRGLNKSHRVLRCNPLNKLHSIEDTFMRNAAKWTRSMNQRESRQAQRAAQRLGLI